MLTTIIGIIITAIIAVGGLTASTVIHDENLKKEIVDYDYKI